MAIVEPDTRVDDIINQLRGNRFDSLALIAVCHEQRLLGVITLEDLFAASNDERAREIMDATPPAGLPSEDQEVAAWRVTQRGESAMAIIDADGKFLGLVPPQSFIAVLLEEHEEDMARLGGFVHEASSAIQAAEEPVVRRYRHRLPWLLLGLVGA
ncbi:MAG: CBS domain-containing protein, partial [Acidimicrobiia bacterium]